jgi:hypothetical protein
LRRRFFEKFCILTRKHELIEKTYFKTTVSRKQKPQGICNPNKNIRPNQSIENDVCHKIIYISFSGSIRGRTKNFCIFYYTPSGVARSAITVGALFQKISQNRGSKTFEFYQNHKGVPLRFLRTFVQNGGSTRPFRPHLWLRHWRPPSPFCWSSYSIVKAQKLTKKAINHHSNTKNSGP